MKQTFVLVVAAFALLAGPSHAGTVPGQYIVVLKDGANSHAAAQRARKLGGDVFAEYGSALHGYAARLSLSQLASVEADPSIQFVSQDGTAEATGDATTIVPQIVPNYIDRIDGELSSTVSGDGTGSVDVNIGVVDTGVDLSNPDLNVVGGTNCIDPKKSYQDDNLHGTAISGMLAAEDNGFGLVGIAPGARLWEAKSFDKHASGKWSSIICGIDWVTATRTDVDPTNDIVVANGSFRGFGSDDGNCGRTNGDPVHLAICNSVAAGVTWVVAAGNDVQDIQNIIPASYDEVLTATAMGDHDGKPGGFGTSPFSSPTYCAQQPDDTAAFFSNFATLPSDEAHTIAAPGLCLLLYVLNGDLAVESGTSGAAPLISGTIALCIVDGRCKGTPGDVMRTVLSDAERYNHAHQGYGFSGDPLRPIEGKYFGYLIRTALY
jgi:subtilisin